MKTLACCLLIFVACSTDTPVSDAGVIDVDASSVDAGGLDAGAPDVGMVECAHGCDEGWRCVEDRCVAPDACLADSDCQDGLKCSDVGRCYQGECLSHGDCEDNQRCREGVCLNRPEPGFVLERVFIDAFEEHVAVFEDPCDRPGMHVCTDVGFGMALLDFDGDQDLDLFIGQGYDSPGSSPACLYRNQSAPGSLAFVPVADYCSQLPNPPTGGHGLDLDQDGRHELLMTGPKRATLQRFYPRAEQIELLDLLPEGDARRNCNAGAAVSFDLNHDGHLDVLVGCQWDTNDQHGNSLINLAFAGDGRGGLRHLDRGEWDREDPILLHALGSTLALGAADLDDDGLLDLLVNEDEGTAIPELFLSGQIDPGGIYLRCPPDTSCGFEPYRLAEPQMAAGGYMGSGVMILEGLGEVTYFSNTGNNRMVQVRPGRSARDFAQRSRTQMGYIGQDMMFSWGVAVDDYNRDGRDDFMLNQGAVWLPSVDTHATHFDALFLQTDDGRFNLHSADRGLAPFTHADSRTEQRVYSSRGLIKVDLDGDGTLEFLSGGKEGAPRLHREVLTTAEHTPRCTIIPKARYAPAFGVGHALVPPEGGLARQWDSQGQLRSGTSPFVVSPWSRAAIRFPSGAVVPFDCEQTAGPILVEEPDWLTLQRGEQGWLVQISDLGPAGSVSALSDHERSLVAGEEIAAGQWRVPLPESTQAVMIRLGDRWIPRWWERP